MNLKKFYIAVLATAMLVSPGVGGVGVGGNVAQAHDGVDVVSLVQQSRDSVVSVGGIAKTRSPSRRGSPFEHFFPFPPEFFERLQPPPNQQPRQRRQSSVGSGFIISSDGYILTNAHVIEGMDKIIIALADDEEYEAEIIGADKLTDIALLKIESDTPLQPFKIGDSDVLQVGQQVLAVGSPFGLDQTVTSGIISALGRRLPSENYVPFIQTDAAINPGNSGGPLINAQGEVIGINSQIISPVRAYAGVSFAIPINVAMRIQERLRTDGVVHRGRLGVYFKSVSKLDAEVFGLDAPRGALVQEVVEDSAAAKAGIEDSDILLAIDGEAVESAADLPALIGKYEPGQEVTITLLREGETLTVTAVLDSLEASRAARRPVLGMFVENLTDEVRNETGIQHGVQIVDFDFDEDVPEGISQLRVGDIITHLVIDARQHQITDTAMFVALLGEAAPGDAVGIRGSREGRRFVITIQI